MAIRAVFLMKTQTGSRDTPTMPMTESTPADLLVYAAGYVAKAKTAISKRRKRENAVASRH